MESTLKTNTNNEKRKSVSFKLLINSKLQNKQDFFQQFQVAVTANKATMKTVIFVLYTNLLSIVD